MDIDAFHEWVLTSLREAGFKFGRRRANGEWPVEVPSFQRLWEVFRESLHQPLNHDCGALVVIEFHGNAKNRTCSVEMARRSGVETWVMGVSVALSSPWPRTNPPPERVVLDQQNHGRSADEDWLLPLAPLLAELENTDTFREVMNHRTSWECLVGLGDYGD